MNNSNSSICTYPRLSDSNMPLQDSLRYIGESKTHCTTPPLTNQIIEAELCHLNTIPVKEIQEVVRESSKSSSWSGSSSSSERDSSEEKP